MNIDTQINTLEGFKNLSLLAKQVVEGYLSGKHKSPFHGFSSEFAEHKIYNKGETTKHIDWKLFAKTDKLYSKHYEDETNLRCHFIIDNSSSMHYPIYKNLSLTQLNKIAFASLACAALMQLLKKQRDAVGLSIFSEKFDYYAPEKSSERHHQKLINILNQTLANPPTQQKTNPYQNLHLIAEKLKRRSLVFLFSDMFQSEVNKQKLFEALQHLKHNKHEIVLFHTIDKEKEIEFQFNNTPQKFIDVETGQTHKLYPENIKANYQKAVANYINELKLKCAQNRIKYVEANTNQDFTRILTTFIIERQKFK